MKTRYNSFAEMEERLKILGLQRQIEVERMKFNIALGKKNLGSALLKENLTMILIAKLYRMIIHWFKG